MRSKELNTFDKSACFTKTALKQLHSGSTASLDKDIQNWLKKGLIIQLKRGLFVTASFYNKEKQPELFLEYVANKLTVPSYLSCDYVLQKHSLLTEAIFGVTSVTVKSSRRFQNKLGSFIYYSVSPKLFTGFVQKPYGDNAVLEATKAKALFDYLYLRQYMFKNFTENEIEELRINFEGLTKKDWHEFKRYSKLCGSKKMLRIYDCLEASC